MPKGDPDPRLAPAPLADVPSLLQAGAERYNEGDFWHAHESWEGAWHALRAAGRPAEAEAVHGMILVAAGFENAKRGKEAGFKRQFAEGLHLLRANAGAAKRLGLAEEREWVEALLTVYLDACRRVDWQTWRARWAERGPPLRLAPGAGSRD